MTKWFKQLWCGLNGHKHEGIATFDVPVRYVIGAKYRCRRCGMEGTLPEKVPV